MENKNCFFPADILVPQVNLNKWSVIACDQYTSEPEYWEKVKEITEGEPSALNIILPECYLKEDNSGSIKTINENMNRYLEEGIFKEYRNAMVYIERVQCDGKLRCGVLGCIDLEQYSYEKKTNAPVRATEQTVISRIPPRVEIRKDAPLELPHIMLLIDDIKREIIEPLALKKQNFEKIYDFELMLKAGRITGYLIDGETVKEIRQKLSRLAENNGGLAFCVGDGNHSLATAKECYLKNRSELCRYALCEFVNVHSDALCFEPIYRVVFGADPKALTDAFVNFCGGEYSGEDAQEFKCFYEGCERTVSVRPKYKLSVGTLQAFLDSYCSDKPEMKIDYIHGEESLKKLSEIKGAVGFIFGGMKKEELFPAVLKDGSLPRKTFSMGHSYDKRFYLEARKIK